MKRLGTMKANEISNANIRQRVKRLVILFMISLILAGISALPMERELGVVVRWFDQTHLHSSLAEWLRIVYDGVHRTNERFPFIAYGTDWLAFAHLVLAVLFVGPLRDPVKNIWVVEFGLIACLAVIPMAFFAGGLRGIPLFWRAIDCAFGVIGGAVLWRAHCDIKFLKRMNSNI